ncbi:DUF262 domain-containing protein [Protaetiibacter intestinalis]|uniref:DUF262 domain-containing protein n=1 Tax=Protaetiibacter intestinalis TaxID=2419774 RepID=A0A387B5K6_9MICO|nr:DUF262 domain-containing protein [Protaetiibacter intestinalis]AYF97001.1 DUF262 domain-containing protein [Protaetiibacter intestinalis]
MSLQEEIEQRAQEIHTDAYSMSINEAVAMYTEGDLDVHPEFQRIFRWTLEQQSKLIESIFLGIPIPPIFVATRKDGVWDVVDGVQRLSTIFRFMGVLTDESGAIDIPAPLKAGEYLDALQGTVYSAEPFDDALPANSFELDDAQRRLFKRARLDFQIVQKESDEQAKYDLFQRLNSGTRLSEQEARNCLAVMLDATFSRWIDSLAADEHFSNVMNISDRQHDEAYDAESVLRFLAITEASGEERQRMGDVGEFLTQSLRKFIADPDFDRSFQEARFREIFAALDDALGSDAFRRHDPQRDRYSGRFSVSAFETVASGLARHWDGWRALDATERSHELQRLVPTVWQDPTFIQRAGGGKAAERRIPWMVEIGERIFSRP